MGESGIRDFVIPLEKDALLESRAGLYSVEEIIPPAGLPQALDATRSVLQKDGPGFILQHFDTFFSILVHGNKLEIPVTMKAFERILKATDQLIGEMDETFDRGRDIRPEDRPRYLCITKMYAYLLSSLACYLEDQIGKLSSSDMNNMGKKKKAAKKSDAEADWEDGRQRVLVTIYKWLQLPLQQLWSPPIVEDLFTTVLAQFCYKVLEQNREGKQKHLRETIFQILGTLVKRYNHGITCVVRIIQLVKLYDTLAAPLAAGVVEIVTESGSPAFIKEILREIDQNEPGESDARNIAMFLEALASSRPDLILPILDNITEYLTSECYSMRNCVIGVLGDVVIGSLTAETLDDEKRVKRDECLFSLEEHLLDNNAYVRSKVLQVWQRLCCQGAIPIAKQASLLEAVTMRLEDKSANVRKQALQLLRALIQGNPFAAKLNQVGFAKQLEEARAKLKELKVTVASQSTPGDTERLELWNALLPDIRKAITQVLAREKDREDSSASSSSSDEEPEEGAEAPLLDPAVEFEKVRQLLLTEEVHEAVTYLKKICANLPGAPKMSGMSQEAKEDCFFIFLLKIFGESQRFAPESGETAQETNAETEQSKQAPSNAELKKRKEELRQKRQLVNYLENCVEFAKGLEAAIPVVENMLLSVTAGDAVEACTFLGAACQFDVPNALAGVRNALFQVFSRDQSVRDNVAAVYKEIYLQNKEANQSTRQKALTSVNGLIELLRGLQPGQSPALSQLISAWRANGELGDEELQVMWEKFSLKIPVTRPEDSRAALMLLSMAAETGSKILTANLEVLIKVGLGERAKNDLLLARDTCRALLKIKQDSGQPETPPIRYPNDHAMFEEILSLVLDNFTSFKEKGYISFVTEAINVIYHLANNPDALIKHLLSEIADRFYDQPTNEDAENQPESAQRSGPTYNLLSRLLFIVGHVSIRHMVFLDNGVYKELKRRNAVRDLKKASKDPKSANASVQGTPASTPSLNATRRPVPTSARQTLRNKEANSTMNNEDNGEEVLEGAVADDSDAEFVTAALENDILSGDGMLARFVPIVLDVCRHPEKYNDEQVQVWGVLALSKMMTVSSIFCVESLQLLVTIMERSTDPRIRANAVVGLSDLTTRFPNQVAPWTSHIYSRLRDDNVKVRSTCVRMLSNLILREMVRVKGQVSGLAISLIDPETEIRVDTREFFKALSCKANALYNVIPDLISRLTDSELDLQEDDFQEIMKYILGLLQKERQIDSIIDQLCSRFKLATTERQWRDLAFCLSLLPFGPKSIRRLIESLPLLKDKIQNKQVLKYLHTISEVTKRKADAKQVCLELEEKIAKILETEENENGPTDDRVAMPPPPVPRQTKQRRKNKQQKNSSSEEDDDEDEEEDNDTRNVSVQNGADRTPSLRKKNTSRKHALHATDSGSDSEENSKVPQKAMRTPDKKALKTPTRAALTRSSVKRKQSVETPTKTPSKPRTKRNKECSTPVAGTSDSPAPTRRSSARVARSASKRS